MRHLAAIASVVLGAIACGTDGSPTGSSTDGGTDAEAGTPPADGGSDGGGACVDQGACSGGTCALAPTCESCSGSFYTMITPQCSCVTGHWSCSHISCNGGCAPNLFVDTSCMVPCGSTDGGTD